MFHWPVWLAVNWFLLFSFCRWAFFHFCPLPIRWLGALLSELEWYGAIDDMHCIVTSCLLVIFIMHVSIRAKFETGQIHGYLVGNSGYACRPYMLTPVANPTTAAHSPSDKAGSWSDLYSLVRWDPKFVTKSSTRRCCSLLPTSVKMPRAVSFHACADAGTSDNVNSPQLARFLAQWWKQNAVVRLPCWTDVLVADGKLLISTSDINVRCTQPHYDKSRWNLVHTRRQTLVCYSMHLILFMPVIPSC